MATIIVENGTGVDGANSYASVDETFAYALARGVVLPDDDQPPPAVSTSNLMILAMDYLNSREYKGAATYIDALPWPRTGFPQYTDETIPLQLKQAQMQLVIELAKNPELVLLPTSAGSAPIKREKIGPLETEYAIPTSGLLRAPRLPAIDLLLRGLVLASGGFAGMRVTRG